MSDDAEAILAELAPLIEKAKAEGMWLLCTYQGMWFSPSELRAQNANGKFIWGACNFKLRDPMEKMEQISGEVERLSNEAVALSARIEKENAIKA